MSLNPYDSFSQQLEDQRTQRSRALSSVAGPAIGLMVVSGFCILLLSFAVPFDVFLIASGAAARLNRRAMDPTVSVAIRLGWACILLAVSCYVFWGALQMKQLVNFRHAKNAAMIACVPCLGPCCLLGIPFGAWGLTVLGQPGVCKTFEN
jgi:hypothetical protein